MKTDDLKYIQYPYKNVNVFLSNDQSIYVRFAVK